MKSVYLDPLSPKVVLIEIHFTYAFHIPYLAKLALTMPETKFYVRLIRGKLANLPLLTKHIYPSQSILKNLQETRTHHFKRVIRLHFWMEHHHLGSFDAFALKIDR